MKKLTLLFLAILPLFFVACSDDDDDNYCYSSNLSEVLQLSLSVNESNSAPFSLSISSPGKVVVDWGDGTESIFTSIAKGEYVGHNYTATTNYEVKVYTESDVLEYLYLYTQPYSTSISILNLNFSRALEIDTLGISFTAKLQSVNLEKCKGLKKLLLSELSDLNSIEGLKSCDQLSQLRLEKLPQITNLDISGNKTLKQIYCYDMPIKTLALDGFSKLESLSLSSTEIASIDLNSLSSLIELSCGSNLLTNLDVSNNTNLIHLACYSNQLKRLDISKNSKLESLYCSYNKIENIILRDNLKLDYLNMNDNNLSAETLNNIFTALPTVSSSESNKPVLYIRGNSGSNTCDESIAINKGWTIY